MMIAAAENGLYRPADTPLHTLDPRLKVAFCLLLVMLSFAAANWVQLALPATVVGVSLWLCRAVTGRVWKLCLMLRWLLLFTLLMHLLFSPGRTLFGVSWLSLDGLLLGSLVCSQMIVAVLASALLALTTSAESLATTLGWYLKPLHYLGFKVAEWQRLMLLSLHFLPVVQEEARSARAITPNFSGRSEAAEARIGRLRQFLHRMIDRGDEVAQGLVADEGPCTELEPLPPLWPLSFADSLFLVAMVLLLLTTWIAG